MPAIASRPRTFLATVTVALLFAQPRPAAAVWSTDPINSVPVCVSAADKSIPVIASDGVGGAYIAWSDNRSGNYDIYVLRLAADGSTPVGWNTNGNAVCTATGDQTLPAISSDGLGGAIITWSDARPGAPGIYAQRFVASGTATWLANGVRLSFVPGTQSAVISAGAATSIVAWKQAAPAAMSLCALSVTGVQNWTTTVSTSVYTADPPKLVSDGAGGAMVGFLDVSRILNAIRVDLNGAVPGTWPPGGLPLHTIGTGKGWDMTTDGAGGAIYTNATDPSYVLQTQRIDGAGASRWNGGPGAGPAYGVEWPHIVSDGVNGCLISYVDSNPGIAGLRMIRYGGGGSIPVTWDSLGIAITIPVAGGSNIVSLVSDGAGGALLAGGSSGGAVDILAQHLGSDGFPVAGWNYQPGNAVCQAGYFQQYPVAVTDGAGGMIVAWQDGRNNTGFVYDIYAARIETFGELGDPRPRIVDIKDVPRDQGGAVRIRWTKTFVDSVPLNRLDAYWIWRQVPATSAVAARMRGATILDGSAMNATELTALRRGGRFAPHQLYRVTTGFVPPVYWEWLAEVEPFGNPTYSYVAATASDSTGGSNPRTQFQVEAVDYVHTGTAETGRDQVRFWISPADSGYSVDNLAPAPPAPFIGNAVAGSTHLHWNPNTEPDLGSYRLYRGGSAGFIPSPGNQIADKPDTGYVDPGSVGSYYKLSAVDIHGNESAYSLLTPTQTSGVDSPSGGLAFSLMPIQPTPTRGSAAVQFELPTSADASVGIYDVSGRLVRTLVNERLAAGRYNRAWDGRNSAGQSVSGGLYLVRLAAGGRSRTQRLVFVP